MNLPLTPALKRHFRLQWEDAQQCHVLLYPEGMVRLNRSAGEILIRCNGQASVDDIVAELEILFKTEGLREDVEGLLAHALEKNWIA
jgi:pyrroloquinoline quinone biosynthesis protein D